MEGAEALDAKTTRREEVPLSESHDRKRDRVPHAARLAEFIDSRSPRQLREILHELVAESPQAARYVKDRVMALTEGPSALLSALRREIDEVCDSGSYWDAHDREWAGPCFDRVQSLLKELIAAGGADEVATLGEDLIQRFSQVVAECHWDDGLSYELRPSVELVVAAVKKSSWSPEERLVWALDVVLDDEYGLADVVEDYLRARHSRKSWDIAAEHLLDRLADLSRARSDKENAGSWRRRHLVRFVVDALERAGRKDEVTALLEEEAVSFGLWDLLIDHLMPAGRYDDVEDRIAKCLPELTASLPGVAARFRGLLREIKARAKDWAAVAVMEAFEFTEAPCVERYRSTEKAANKVECWEAVRRTLLSHLQTGKPPWRQSDWPLAQPQAMLTAGRRRSGSAYPDHSTLIDLAISERDPEQVLIWYDRQKASRGMSGVADEHVAEAVRDHAPERAIEIWQTLALRQINHTTPAAYQAAGRYLRKVKQTMTKVGQTEGWCRYLATLREAHRRKRRLLEVLDGLE